MKTLSRLLFVLLIAVMIAQYSDTAATFLDLWNRKVYPNRTLNSGERGADYIAGYNYYRYIEFIQENVPEGERVVIIGQGPNAYYSHRNIISFLVFNRQISVCEQVQDCVGLVSADDAYLLVLNQQDDLDLESRRAIEMSDMIVLFSPVSR
jgi:hypothetical protein